MNNVRFFTKVFLIASFCFAFVACSNNDIFDLEQDKTTTHTIAMQFIGDVVGFDQQSAGSKSQSRASASSWTDGDKIYIAFYDGSKIVPGEAIYNSSSGWSVTYNGNLAEGTNLKCEARYFVNATLHNSSVVTLNANTEIYEDLNGTYTYTKGSLIVSATLAPKTGRIRFTGTSDQKIHLTGITTYTSFAPEINTFTTSEDMIHQSVAPNGSTPYIYGFMSSVERKISLVGSDFAYNRTLAADVLKTGESGYMAIPSDSSHNNWRSGLYLKVKGVEIKMIPVAGLKSGFFLIGETEVTEALYHTVLGKVSASQLPVSYVTYREISDFIEKLNYSTKLSFALPNENQWKFAAKGGKYSQNYNYAGSNIPGDVAWYKGNTSSKQRVKLKTPNELGIYDMSGNVAEYTSTPNHIGIYYHYYGGSYESSESSCQIQNANNSSSNGYDTVGFRLILTCE